MTLRTAAWLSVTCFMFACGGGPQALQAASAAGGVGGGVMESSARASSGSGAVPAGSKSAGAGAVAGGGGRAAGGAGGQGSLGASGAAAGSAAGSGGAVAMGGTTGAAGGPSCAPDFDASAPPKKLELSGNLGTHDPSMIEVQGQYFLYHTGAGLPIKRSSDLVKWQTAGRVFATNPAWIAQKIPSATDLWAPDISYFEGQYHLYYAASKLSSNNSCIGHATSPALDANQWTDRGLVICSNDGTKDDWNAIDPNLILDASGKPFLVFGSFWGGLKLIELDKTGARANDKLTAVAARPDKGGALEAPYIVQRCGYYYLFMSFDKCCVGANSTYKIMVGRATDIAGPYADKAGTALMKGGGTLLVQSDDTWHGPGHNAVIVSRGHTYNVYHSYYAGANTSAYNKDGSYLRISEMAWGADGWPVSAGP